MGEKTSQTPSFEIEWTKGREELYLLLNNETFRFCAKVGSIRALEVKRYIVQLPPKNGASREMLENYLGKKKRSRVGKRRGFHVLDETQKAFEE